MKKAPKRRRLAFVNFLNKDFRNEAEKLTADL